MLLMATMLCAEPSVTITVDGTTPTTITCSFQKNADCASYYIVASEPENIEPWVGTPYGGATLEETVEKWGIKYTADATYTWTEMTPNTMYVIYVTAKDAQGARVLCTDTVYTPKGGGPGESIVTVKAENITSNGATLTATPNDQTMLFKDMVMVAAYTDSIYGYYYALDTATARINTADSIFRLLDEFGTVFYEEDSYPWATLAAETRYYFIARGMNADSIWGEMVKVEFTTLAATAVENVEVSTIAVYPNPATDYINVEGVEMGERIQVIDIRGIVVMDTEESQISVSGLQAGVYFVKSKSGVCRFVKR